jgi:hypothetical protein
MLILVVLFFLPLVVLILFCRFAMASSGPKLDLDFFSKRKDNVDVPQGIDTPMCFCGDNCKLVRCKVLGYALRDEILHVR